MSDLFCCLYRPMSIYILYDASEPWMGSALVNLDDMMMIGDSVTLCIRPAVIMILIMTVLTS